MSDANEPEVEVVETGDTTQVTVTASKAATKAALQENLAQARQQAEAFEASAVARLIAVVRREDFRACIIEIQEAAEDLITPVNKLHVLQLLKGIQGLEKVASIVQAKAAQQ